MSADTPKSKSLRHSLVELLLIVAVAVGLAFGIQAFVVKPYKIPSGSMEPTLDVGQRVLVDRLAMAFGTPSVGDIIVFHPPKVAEEMLCGPTPHITTSGGRPCDSVVPKESEETYIKRIVAGPGDELYVRDGHVYIKQPGASSFHREHDSYIKPCTNQPECNFPVPVKVPAGHWFVMGDNRGDSDDSRYWGPVPTAWIIGEAFATYWPPSRIGSL